MAGPGTREGDCLRRRRWSFADCIFDEGNWTLTVGGRRVAVETKPLELLRTLLEQAGNLVSKDDLLDAIWPDVMVVEASLPTAVHKLRTALNDDRRTAHIIETVPRLGYRLAVPATVEEIPVPACGAAAPLPPAADDEGAPAAATGRRGWRGRRLLLASGVLVLGIGAAAIPLTSAPELPTTKAAPAFTQQDATNALRRLDVAAIERMLAAGWDPNRPVEAEGNAALHYTVEMCEWDRGHDQNRLLLMVRTLYEGGARLEQRNVWGDTVYSIAKAPRYCGPNHPVTRSLRATCTGPNRQVEDHCLASYEIARRDRR